MNAACAFALKPNPSFELSLPLHCLDIPTLIPYGIFALEMLLRYIFTSRGLDGMSGDEAAFGVIRPAETQYSNSKFSMFV